MTASADHTARRRPRARAVFAAACALAAASLVLGHPGGTYALWSDALTVDLGVIQLDARPGQPATPFQCVDEAEPRPYHPFTFAPQPALAAWTQLSGFLVNPETGARSGRLTSQVEEDGRGIVHVNGGHASDIGIAPRPGEYTAGVLRIVLGGDASFDGDVVAEGTIWFTGNEWSNAVLVACGPPPATADIAAATDIAAARDIAATTREDAP